MSFKFIRFFYFTIGLYLIILLFTFCLILILIFTYYIYCIQRTLYSISWTFYSIQRIFFIQLTSYLIQLSFSFQQTFYFISRLFIQFSGLFIIFSGLSINLPDIIFFISGFLSPFRALLYLLAGFFLSGIYQATFFIFIQQNFLIYLSPLNCFLYSSKNRQTIKQTK